MALSEKELRKSRRRWKARHARYRRLLAKAKAMYDLRGRQLKKLDTGPRKALAFARNAVGTAEKPPFSNRGTKIDAWQRMVQMQGQPWCGAFTYAALKAAGVKGLSWRMRYTPWIRDDARKGQNGLASFIERSEARFARPGDLVLFDFPDSSTGIQHVGILVRQVGASTIETIEGNTSPGTGGSQDNGGGVYKRTRPLTSVVGFARPRWP